MTNDPTERMAQVDQRLADEFPEAECELNFANPLQLLVATILAAQTTDKQVNAVTAELFAKYPTASAFAEADLDELTHDVSRVGSFRNKARNIHKAAQMLVEQYGGQVPADVDALIALPGVGRKTALVVLGNAFACAEGMVVDTHVGRLARRLGFSTHEEPLRVEADLTQLAPRSQWIALGNRLGLHGRRVCKARKPLCSQCVLNDLCPQVGVIDAA